MTDLCPLHCVNIACKQPSFLEQHETFILTIIGIGGSGLGVLLAYFIKRVSIDPKNCFRTLTFRSPRTVGAYFGCLSSNPALR